MDADINTLYESTFYRIMDFKCRCVDCRTSKPEYNEAFCISFVRKGNFLFNIFRRTLDSYTGCVLITKPGCERTVTHAHSVPDECTIFEFKHPFYQELLLQYGKTTFFADHDLHSTLYKTTPETEFLHFYIARLVLTRTGSKLQIDNLVLEMMHKILGTVTDYTPDHRIHARLKQQHLTTIELAKQYITEHYTDDIALQDLATHCLVSPFHFSRIFKTFTQTSPHQFLLTIRLKNAELLLKETALPVADIAFTSGFNSIEHFTTAFRQKYKCPPASYRSQLLSTS
ncbi:AraC family transcriptional regulator [Paraflavitalea sp. CAU 1676]|uniref:helix-turn-helix domain-containing protein n=1 Tax=Paraflavitalea sp. CAU 1676 TaxID=3032598 RepID=UPI0023DC6043|nr:AraC family transcriptional regulator [Paraflavitalea sp. CAU 1676]MDF2192669.1 AraC family transcriptional regulator [Paraflavitalea sp. CAU 1676]